MPTLLVRILFCFSKPVSSSCNVNLIGCRRSRSVMAAFRGSHPTKIKSYQNSNRVLYYHLLKNPIVTLRFTKNLIPCTSARLHKCFLYHINVFIVMIVSFIMTLTFILKVLRLKCDSSMFLVGKGSFDFAIM